MKFLLNLFLFLVLIVCSAVTSTVIVTRSESAARFVLYSLDTWTNGLVRVEGFSGRVVGGFSIDYLEIDLRDVVISLEGIRAVSLLDIDLSLQLSSLHTEHLRIEVLDVEDPKGGGIPGYFSMPIEVVAKAVSVGQFDLVIFDKTLIDGVSVTGAAHLKDTMIAYSDVSLSQGTERLTVSGALYTENIYPNNTQFTLTTNATLPATEINGVLSESITAPKISMDVSGWLNGRLIVDVPAYARSKTLPIYGDFSTLTFGDWTHWPLDDLAHAKADHVSVRAIRDKGDWSIEASSQVDVTHYLSEIIDVEFQGRWFNTEIHADSYSVAFTVDDDAVRFSGEGSLDYGLGQFNLLAQSADLSFELEDYDIRSEDAILRAQGEFDQYTLDVSGHIGSAFVGDMRVAASGKGDLNAIALDLLRVSNQNYEVTGLARIDWASGLRLESSLAVDHLNVDFLMEGYSSDLSTQLNIETSLIDDVLRADFDILNLQGTLFGRSIDGQGGIGYDGHCWALQQIEVFSGEDSLNATGTTCPVSPIELNIALADIGAWAGDSFSGAIQADMGIEVGESLYDSSFRIEVDSSELGWGGRYYVDQLTLAASGALEIADNPLEVHAQVASARMDGIQISNLSFDVSGTSGDHQFTLINGDPASDLEQISVLGQGRFEGRSWVGLIESAMIHGRNEWTLRSASDIYLGADLQRLDQMCLQASAGGHLCVAFDTTPASQQSLSLDLKDVPIHWLSPIYPSVEFATNTLEGTLFWNFQPEQAIADTDLYLKGEGLSLLLPNGTIESFPLKQISLKTSMSAGDVLIQSAFDFGSDNVIDISGTLSDPYQNADFDLRIAGSIDDFVWLDSKLGDIENLNTDIELNATLKGEPLAPKIEGELRLIDGRFIYRPLQTLVQEVDATLVLNDKGVLTLNGQADLGGRLDIMGQYDIPASEVNINLQGEYLQIAQSNSLTAMASVDLLFSASKGAFGLSGDTVIHSGKYKFSASDSNIQLSEDVVFTDGREAEQPSIFDDLRYALDINTSITPGFEVLSNDFYANVGGRVSLDKEVTGPIRATGSISSTDGHYKIYSTYMPIVSARLVYSGGSLSNPQVEAKIEKNVDDVIVGLEIDGTADRLIASLYSQPFMTNTEKLSYLIFEAPASEDTAAQLAFIQATQLIDNRTNISNILGQTTVAFTGTKAAVGRQINRHFWVGLNYYLNESNDNGSTSSDSERNTEFIVKYRYDENLSVESRAGEEQSIDAYYSFEFSENIAEEIEGDAVDPKPISRAGESLDTSKESLEHEVLPESLEGDD